MSKRLMSRIGAACLHLALSAGALSAVNASPSYYRARRGAYGGGARQYLADPGMRQLSATTFPNTAQSHKEKGNSPAKFSAFHFQKNHSVRELVIVDSNIQNKHMILNQIKPGLDVVEVMPGLAGMEALTSILKRYKGLEAVHIVSHADAGVLHIGGQPVNQDVLQRHIADFSIVNEAIKEGGDLLLYGCDLAKGESGDQFLEVIRKNTHVDVAASSDKTGNVQYGGDWELEVSKGDIDATPLPGSLALRDFTGTLQFSGTIDFSEVKTVGTPYSADPAINAEFWEGSSRNHVLIVDGAAGPTYTFGNYASFGAYYDETSVVLKFAANETFDPKSITLFNWAGGSVKYTVTSDKGGQIESGMLSSIGQTLDISTLPAGTSTLTITADGRFWGGVDNLAVENLKAPGANSAPVASAVSFTGTTVVGETLTGSYTFTDTNGDAESGSTYKWYRSDDASGTNKTSISGATSKTYTLQVADQGKYLSFEVTPRDGSLSGTAVESSRQGPVSPALKATISAQTNVACNGGSTGSITSSGSGGTGPYSYSWSPSGGSAATASGLSAGTYTITVTDANGKTATASTTILQPAALAATTSQTNVTCNGDANGSASVSVSGGTAGYTYSWAPSGGTAATASGLSAGTYTVTITDANACELTKDFIITQPAAISATTSQTNVSCNGGADGAASVSVSGGAGSYTYSWAPSGGTAATASGLSAGTYTVTVTDANACELTKDFTITQPAAISATTSQTNVSCNGGADGAASVSVSGGAGSYTYSWAPSGGTAATASGLSAGTYTVTVTDANGCEFKKPFSITQPATLLATSASTDVTSRGGTDGTATVTASGGTSPYSYSWAPSGGTDATATGLSADTYTCTITDANNCQTTEQVTVVETNAAPVASAVSFSGILTSGQTLTGSYSYSDTDGDAESGSTFKWYRSTDASGSGKTAIVGATAITYTLATADENAFVSFEVTASDGISSGASSESPLRGPVSPKLSATVSMNDANLVAEETTLVTITFNKAVTGFSNADVTVENGSLSTVSSSDGGVTWTATFTPDAGVEQSTNAIHLDLTTVTDGDGIAGTGVASSPNFTLDTKRPVATVSLSDVALRAGETATVTIIFNEVVTGLSATDITSDNGTLSAPATSDGITWTATFTPAANTEQPVNKITVDPSGVTDAAGNAGSGTTDSDHYAIDTMIPDAPGTPDLDAISDTGNSDSDDLTKDPTPLIRGEAEANSTVTVSDQAGVVGTVTADAQGKWMLQISTPLSEGAHQFTAVATDAAGNVSTSSPVLTIILDTTSPATPPTADLDAGSDTGASNTDNFTSDVTPTLLGTAEASVTVVIRSDLDGTLGSVHAEGSGAWAFTSPVLSQGIHALSCIAVDAAGNESVPSPDLSVSIDTEAPVVAHVADQTIPLHGNTGNLPFSVSDNLAPSGALTIEAGTSNLAIAPTLGGTVTDNHVYVSGAESGQATITITVTDLAGNHGTGTFMVTVNTSPSITGAPASHVNQDAQYNFVPLASDPDEADALTFSIENKPPWATFNIATGALTGIPAREDVGVTNDIVITVTDGTASASLTAFTIEVIYVNASPADILLSSVEVEENQPVGTLVGMLSSVDPDENNAHSYTFVPGTGSGDNALFYIDGNELFTKTYFDSEVKDTYQIRIQTNDGDGGVLEKTFDIRVKDIEDSRVFIPNLFSPNGDGSNETFRVRANGITEVVFRVFNRWGEMVYETSDIQQATETGWDGNYHGKEQPSGTYVWQLIGRFTDGTPVQFDGKNTGNVTLIR